MGFPFHFGGEKTLNPKGWTLFFLLFGMEGRGKGVYFDFFWVWCGGGEVGWAPFDKEVPIVGHRCGRAYLSKPPPKNGQNNVPTTMFYDLFMCPRLKYD